MATRVIDGIKFCKQFLKGLPKEHSCQVWLKLAQRFGRSWYLNLSKISSRETFWPSFMIIWLKMWPLERTLGFSKIDLMT